MLSIVSPPPATPNRTSLPFTGTPPDQLLASLHKPLPLAPVQVLVAARTVFGSRTIANMARQSRNHRARYMSNSKGVDHSTLRRDPYLVLRLITNGKQAPTSMRVADEGSGAGAAADVTAPD